MNETSFTPEQARRLQISVIQDCEKFVRKTRQSHLASYHALCAILDEENPNERCLSALKKVRIDPDILRRTNYDLIQENEVVQHGTQPTITDTIRLSRDSQNILQNIVSTGNPTMIFAPNEDPNLPPQPDWKPYFLEELIRVAAQYAQGMESLRDLETKPHRNLAVQSLIYADIQTRKRAAMKKARTAGTARVQPHSDDGPMPVGDPNSETEAVQIRYLVAESREGKLDPVIGREEETDQLIHVLGRRKKKNPVLLGDAGIGKTAIVHNLAHAIASGKVPGILKDREIFELDMGSMVAGTRFRGDFEEKLLETIDKAKKENAILFIDEIHTILGAGGTTTNDAASLLKPVLTDEDFSLVGATTQSDWRSGIENNPALLRRFTPIMVKEPDEAKTLNILRALVPNYEKFHEVVFPDSILQNIIYMSGRHLVSRKNPDRSVDCMDFAGIATRLDVWKNPKLRPDDGTIVVTPAGVEAAISKITGTPLEKLSRSEKQKLRGLADALRLNLFGQDEAIADMVRAVTSGRLDIQDANRPIGIFMCLGRTGVGKTEAAKTLADVLDVELIRIDMSEYKEQHRISALIGAPAGYVGFNTPSKLCDAIRDNPDAVVLFDEIEKAHRDVYQVLLGMMDTGILTDGSGKEVDFRRATIIMTSNVGMQNAEENRVGFTDPDGKLDEYSFAKSRIDTALKSRFPPEFRNRLDRIIYFNDLGHEEMLLITDKFFKQRQEQYAKRRIHVEMTPAAREWLAKEGYDIKMGARPLKRLMNDCLSNSSAFLLDDEAWDDQMDSEIPIRDFTFDLVEQDDGTSKPSLRRVEVTTDQPTVEA